MSNARNAMATDMSVAESVKEADPFQRNMIAECVMKKEKYNAGSALEKGRLRIHKLTDC